ncbi:MAG: long-chain fatty acid--CoA ligase [Planctomycetales bacterium]|nr:long-chain fatty acid--CoA ligase [Planctomycetales bacterium]
MPPAPTILAFLFRSAKQHADAPAIWGVVEDRLEPVTWSELLGDVSRLAAALRLANIEPGDRVATIADNRYEWIVADLGILLARAVHVPIHTSLSGEQITYQLLHSGAKIAILGGQDQAEKLAPYAERLADECRFFTIEPFKKMERHAPIIERLAELVAESVTAGASFDAAREAAKIVSGDLATIMYTSGTTGEPKGVMLSHGNLASNAWATATSYDEPSDEMRLCLLPLSHIYGRTCDLYCWLARGTQMALARSRETVLEDAQIVKPTVINAVPYFYERVYRRLREQSVADKPGVLKRVLGGRIRTCFSGGAALPQSVAKFFRQQQLALFDGYGLSEASPVVAISTRKASREGTVGQPLTDVEVKIAPDGEVLTKGPHVMLGYWDDPQATAAAMENGWLKTGDLGAIDDDGFLKITGRKKELIVLSTGKNVAPTQIERLLVDSPLIALALVLGDGRPFLSALIAPDPERLRLEMRERGIHAFTRKGVLAHARVRDLYRHEIARILKNCARHEQIGAFTLIGRAFSLEQGEMTPKGSFRREVIAENFAAEIEAMYREEKP